MSENLPLSQPGGTTCPNCGAIQPSDATFCVQCGARLTPIDADGRFKLSLFSLLLTLPAISVLALGSCAASLAIVVGVVLFDWKIVAIGAGVLFSIFVLGRILNFFDRKP